MGDLLPLVGVIVTLEIEWAPPAGPGPEKVTGEAFAGVIVTLFIE